MNKEIDIQFAQFMSTVIKRANKEVSKKNRVGLAAFYDANPSDLDIIYAALDNGWDKFKLIANDIEKKAGIIGFVTINSVLLGALGNLLSSTYSYLGNKSEALKSLQNNTNLINDIISVGDELINDFSFSLSEEERDMMLDKGCKMFMKKVLAAL